MFDLNGARQDLATVLETGGIKATTDPRNVNAPMVVVGLPTITEWIGACVVNIDIPITAVAPGPGNLDAVEWLLDTVAALLELFPFSLASPTSFEAVPGQQPLSAYALVVTTQVKEI